MLQFFRKIRKSLLTQNSFSKYFLYALGEIVLVVIGILIALQVNNWNQERLEREEEREILQKLHREFSRNLETMQGIQEANIRRSSALDTLMPLLGNSERLVPFLSKMDLQDIDLILGGTTYDPIRGTVESLISSGEIRLISNDSLRELLTAWPYILEDYKEEEEADLNWGKEITMNFLRNGDIEMASDPQVAVTLFQSPFNQRVLLLRNRSIKNLVQAANTEGLLPLLEQVVSLTETELRARE